jgi:hypothetical protein
MSAQIAISSLDYKRARIESRKARKAAKDKARPELIGVRFAESRSEWLKAGGDLLDCPF